MVHLICGMLLATKQSFLLEVEDEIASAQQNTLNSKVYSCASQRRIQRASQNTTSLAIMANNAFHQRALHVGISVTYSPPARLCEEP